MFLKSFWLSIYRTKKMNKAFMNAYCKHTQMFILLLLLEGKIYK